MAGRVWLQVFFLPGRWCGQPPICAFTAPGHPLVTTVPPTHFTWWPAPCVHTQLVTRAEPASTQGPRTGELQGVTGPVRVHLQTGTAARAGGEPAGLGAWKGAGDTVWPAHPLLTRPSPSGGGVLVVESLLDADGRGPLTTQLYSLNMLVQTEGQERTPAQYQALLAPAGFRDVRCKRTGGIYDAILARK